MTSAPAASAAFASATVEMLANQVIRRSFMRLTNGAGYRPITDDKIGGAISSMASHCSSKFGGTASPASVGTAGPHLPRNSRTRAYWFVSLFGLGSGIQMLSWNAPLLLLRTSLAQDRISSGCINNTPHDPSPPALETAIESDGAEAPAIGAS